VQHKAFGLWGKAPKPLTRGSVPGPRWGHSPQTPQHIPPCLLIQKPRVYGKKPCAAHTCAADSVIRRFRAERFERALSTPPTFNRRIAPFCDKHNTVIPRYYRNGYSALLFAFPPYYNHVRDANGCRLFSGRP